MKTETISNIQVVSIIDARTWTFDRDVRTELESHLRNPVAKRGEAMESVPVRHVMTVCIIVGWLATSAIAQNQNRPVAEFTPDPAASQRFGAGWKHPQAGWLVVHIEGSPYERGLQHGRLLAREIVDYIQVLARTRSHKDPDAAWKSLRLLADAAFLRKFDVEFLEEMKGIADGAASVGAKLDGRRIDLLDVVALNADVEVGFLESALEVTPNGLDAKRFDPKQASHPFIRKREQCSAFVATTPATDASTGGVMLGHITMSDLSWVPHFNVWLDVTPAKGHRFVCQTFPGGILSGLDYYISASGLIIAETTIDQTFFNMVGDTVASRIRRAVQYAESIDQAVELLAANNNGLYTNEWLLADTKTNEIAMFELGTKHTRLWRSSRDEWPGGTKGFYWGCNNAKDRDVLGDTVADPLGKPANLVLYPGRRDVAWLKLFEKHRQHGGLAEAFGFEVFRTPPIVGYPSCDAKFTTSVLAKDLSSWALFGPPLGKAWTPSREELEADPEARPLVANAWTLLNSTQMRFNHNGQAGGVLKSKSANAHHAAESDAQADVSHAASVAVDLDPFPDEDDVSSLKFDQRHPFAWRGTLRPKSEADQWLAAAFSEYEKVVSFENALLAEASIQQPSKGDANAKSTLKLNRAERDLVDVALFTTQSNWWAARQRLGRDLAPQQVQIDWRNLESYPIAAGQGIALLHALRTKLTPSRFDRCMDEFGTSHPNAEVTAAEFREFFEQRASQEAAGVFAEWLDREVSAKHRVGGAWSIYSFEPEPERALIVFGQTTNAVANHEIAVRLQRTIERRFANVAVPIKGDRDVVEDDLKSHHILIVGEPPTNAWLRQAAARSPVKFGSQSFAVRGDTFAHPDSGVIVASENPWNDRFSVVVFAGLSTSATYRLVDSLSPDEETSPQVVVFPANRKAQRFVVR